MNVSRKLSGGIFVPFSLVLSSFDSNFQVLCVLQRNLPYKIYFLKQKSSLHKRQHQTNPVRRRTQVDSEQKKEKKRYGDQRNEKLLDVQQHRSTIPSRSMPTRRHLVNRHDWQDFLRRLVISQSLVAGQVYSILPEKIRHQVNVNKATTAAV